MRSRGVGGLALLLVGILAGCGGKPPAGGPGGPGGGGGGLPVKIETVQVTDLRDASEYLATLKSRHSVNVQPQTEGVITQIFVKSGDRVRPGAPLLQIDPGRQRAAVRSEEANRAMRRAALDYAQKQQQRMETLYKGGAVAKQSLEQAESALRQARADYEALGAQVEEQQVQLRYFRVAAPAGGVVGDIPVRVGDRVTPATLLTTLDENTALEVYIAIPLERSKDLRPGLPVEIVGEDGTILAASAVSYIAPQVDDQTQSVLIKAPITNPGSPPNAAGPANAAGPTNVANTGSLRAGQVVRARVIWSTHRGPVLPLLAVTRTSGQYFAFVAEPGPGGKGLFAHQRPIQVGEVVGNDYVVLAGIKPGERVVTGGVQKLADGAPVTPLP
ncbi:MAG TPA: efflux RND transporter periplasmic adaptor subunit [Thermoanaerobaculia bacterium]|nr:efflux RND transporter periplasmic adaptor subunit [Thermoanaerobaculia bacterium]